MIDKNDLKRLEVVTADLRDAFSRFQQSVELLAQVQHHLNETLLAVKGLDDGSDEDAEASRVSFDKPDDPNHVHTLTDQGVCIVCGDKPTRDIFKPTFPPPGEHHHGPQVNCGTFPKQGAVAEHVFQSKTGVDSCDVCGCRLDHVLHIRMQPATEKQRYLHVRTTSAPEPITVEDDELISVGVQAIGMNREPLTREAVDDVMRESFKHHVGEEIDSIKCTCTPIGPRVQVNGWCPIHNPGASKDD